MFESFITSLGSKLFITLLLTSTVLTTGVAISKVSSSIASENIPNNGINIASAQEVDENIEVEEILEASPTKAFVASVVANVTKIPTITKAFLPATTPTIKPVSNTTSGCIITLSGQEYDVTKLRSTHSGGDVFNCGTDMTTIYTNKHGSSLSRMQKYLVTNTGGAGSTQGTSPQPKFEKYEDNDDREDNEHEDRYFEKREREDHDDENDD